MDYSRPTRIAKLTGFPEIRSSKIPSTPPRVIDVRPKPSTVGRQRTRPSNSFDDHLKSSTIFGRQRTRPSSSPFDVPKPFPRSNSHPIPSTFSQPTAYHNLMSQQTQPPHHFQIRQPTPQPAHYIPTRQTTPQPTLNFPGRQLTPQPTHRPHRQTTPQPTPQTTPQPTRQSIPDVVVNIQPLEKEIQTLRCQLEGLTKLLESCMKIHHEQTSTITNHHTEDDSLADVSIDSREYMRRHNLFLQ